MKRIIYAALAAALLAGTAAGQPSDPGGRGDRDNGSCVDGGGFQNRQVPPPQVPPAPLVQPQQTPQPQQGLQPRRGSYLRSPAGRRDEYPRDAVGRDDPRTGQGDRGNHGRGFRYGPQDDNRGVQADRRNGQVDRPRQDFRGGVPTFRDRDRGRAPFDQRRHLPSYRAPQRFRIAPYRAPPGFYSRSWSFGDRLPFGWHAPGAFLSLGAYGLPLPPIGCEWVRVGEDALLVEVWTGEVLSVYYGLFWR